jgi:hypothetical protein
MRLRIRLRFEVITEAVDVEAELLCVADQIVHFPEGTPLRRGCLGCFRGQRCAGSCRWFERLETLQVDAANPVSLDDDHHHAGAVSAPDDCSRPAQIDGELTQRAAPSTTRARTGRRRQFRVEDRDERAGDRVSVERCHL